MTICTIDKQGNCNRHPVKHIGRLAQLAVEESERGEKYRRKWDELYGITPKPLLRSLPLAKQCSHNTGENGRAKAGCTTCVTYGCTVKGTVRVSECVYCEEFKSPGFSGRGVEKLQKFYDSIGYRKTIRFDHHNLSPEIPEYRFNPSIIESGEGYLFTYRNGWKGSNIYGVRLDQQFKPVSESKLLDLNRNGSGYGREDSRLFRLNGKLHIMYIGVIGRYGPTNVLFARLNEETLEVEDKFFPRGFPRQSWEKNWQFFDYQGIAHAVYSINPHKILRIEGSSAQFVYETPFKGSWSGGYMRGGASPVLHNGEWWCFFHGKWDRMRARLPHQPTSDPMRHVYNFGVYTFSPEPPFQILRYSPHPLEVAEVDMHDGNYCDCLFPGGAVLKDGVWAVAMGINDRRSEIRFYDHDWIESQLVDHEATNAS
jgi:predicted GH43/DUF377 family glycosyl hydrolase